MQQVDHFLRQAKAARALAANTDSDEARTLFEQIAAAWENLAKERLAMLRRKAGPDAT
jgi:alpha-ketoglutarate-dependent taurine dioxygenase